MSGPAHFTLAFGSALKNRCAISAQKLCQLSNKSDPRRLSNLSLVCATMFLPSFDDFLSSFSRVKKAVSFTKDRSAATLK